MSTGSKVGIWLGVISVPFIGMIAGANLANWCRGDVPSGVKAGLLIGIFFMMALCPFVILATADESEEEQERSSSSNSLPRATKQQIREAERERDEQMAELKAANLDPITAEAQRQEIESNYQRRRSEG